MKHLVAALALVLVVSCEKVVPDEIVNPVVFMPPITGGDGDGDGDEDADDDEQAASDGGVPGSDGGTEMDASEPPPPEEFTKRGLLRAASACAVAHYDAFEVDARTLRDTTRAWTDA